MTGRWRRIAFSLVELLVVVAIIALLVGILVPSLGRAKWLARKTICQGNLNTAGRDLRAYATEYRGWFPTCGFRNSTQFDIIGFNVTQASTSNDTTASGSSNSRNLFLALRLNAIPPAGLICPNTRDVVAPLSAGTDTLYDFDAPNKFSYSYHVMFADRTGPPLLKGFPLTLTNDAAQPVLADRNPLVKYGASGTGGATSIGPASPTLCSRNHDGEGQNVLMLDGHSEWTVSPVCGGDNIYTVFSGTNFSTGAIAAGSMPQAESDSFLAP